LACRPGSWRAGAALPGGATDCRALAMPPFAATRLGAMDMRLLGMALGLTAPSVCRRWPSISACFRNYKQEVVTSSAALQEHGCWLRPLGCSALTVVQHVAARQTRLMDQALKQILSDSWRELLKQAGNTRMGILNTQISTCSRANEYYTCRAHSHLQMHGILIVLL